MESTEKVQNYKGGEIRRTVKLVLYFRQKATRIKYTWVFQQPKAWPSIAEAEAGTPA